MKCHICPNELGTKYVTLIGPTERDTFNVCWECWQRLDTKMTGYHPSIHNDGPPQ